MNGVAAVWATKSNRNKSLLHSCNVLFTLKGFLRFFAFLPFLRSEGQKSFFPLSLFWRGRKLICFNGNEREVSSGGAVSKSQERRRIQCHSGMGFGRRDPKILLGGRRNRQCSILLARKRSLRKLLLQCKTGNTLIQERLNIFTHFWGIGIPPETIFEGLEISGKAAKNSLPKKVIFRPNGGGSVNSVFGGGGRKQEIFH